MNDRHGIYVEYPPQLLQRHPEMVLKGGTESRSGGWISSTLEVRDYIFKVMEEMATAYDIDGLELDWMRWCQMFTPDVPREKRFAIMTEYHRRVRSMLDNAGNCIIGGLATLLTGWLFSLPFVQVVPEQERVENK